MTRSRSLGWTRLLGLVICAGFSLSGVSRSDDPSSRPTSSERTSSGRTSAPVDPPRQLTVSVAALGRIEPRHGLIRVAGPSGLPAVIAELKVEEGDLVEKGQLLALLDTFELHAATVERRVAELRTAQLEYERNLELRDRGNVSQSLLDSMDLEVQAAKAELRRARAQCELDRVRAPVTGQIIEIHSRAGERIGSKGLLELGRTSEMFAIAEVYETDVHRLRTGQRATISSPALPHPIGGVVEWIHLKVGKLDVLGADPAARSDARVVEVEIRLDDSAIPAPIHLQVVVRFEP